MAARLRLLRGLISGRPGLMRVASRQLYTDPIYPYPYNYVNNVKYPSQSHYRETFRFSETDLKSERIATNLFRVFWTIWWLYLFDDPGVFLGHWFPPDPTNWSDAELGIPPDDFGTYQSWLERKSALKQEN